MTKYFPFLMLLSGCFHDPGVSEKRASESGEDSGSSESSESTGGEEVSESSSSSGSASESTKGGDLTSTGSSSDSSESSGDGSSERPEEGQYARCGGGANTHCGSEAGCLYGSDIDTGVCAQLCKDVNDCDSSPGGTSVPICAKTSDFNDNSWCVLDCSDGKICPKGMVCRNPVGSQLQVCF